MGHILSLSVHTVLRASTPLDVGRPNGAQHGVVCAGDRSTGVRPCAGGPAQLHRAPQLRAFRAPQASFRCINLAYAPAHDPREVPTTLPRPLADASGLP